MSKRSLRKVPDAVRPTLVSLFTGAGGLDIGLEAAGFETVAAVDNDARCVETLRENAGRRLRKPRGGTFLERARVARADVAELRGGDLWPGDGLSGPTLMAGGPPCQPFSSSGKMLSLSDPRGRLFEHYVRLAAELRPDFILFENVRGLVTARGPSGVPGEALHLVRDAFEGIGYATSFSLLNAADFGCPQRRVRLFMFGARRHAVPAFPRPTHAEDGGGTLFSPEQPWVPLRAVLEDEPSPEDVVRPTARLAPLLAALPLNSGLKSAGARETTRPGGHWGYRQGTFVVDPDRPARTVTASAAQDWVRLPDGTCRRLTWRECARLQGFPDEWTFAGDRDDKYRQVGNAVPAQLGRFLGEAILGSAAREVLDAERAGAPLPEAFRRAISYTIKEHARNGDSRARVRSLTQEGSAAKGTLKGLGRAAALVGADNS